MTLRVQAEMCETCIFRPGNPMMLSPRRVSGMVAECDRRDTHIICHDTIDNAANEEWDGLSRPMTDSEAVCRGYYDTGRRSQLLRIAERLGMVEMVS